MTNGKSNSKTIALVQWISSSQEISDSYYYSLRLIVGNYLTSNGYNIQRFYTNNMESLINSNEIDGIVCFGKFSKNQAHILKEKFNYVVFADYNPDNRFFSAVVSDLSGATIDMMQYLKECGHLKIGFIGGKEYSYPEKKLIQDVREITYLEFIKTYDELEYDPEFVMVGNFDTQTGYDNMKIALEKENCPTAFLCADDLIALGALRALSEDEQKRKISVVGYNDISVSEFSDPPLTTVRVDISLMGKLASKLIMLMITDKISEPITMTCQTHIVKRESVYDLN